MTPANDTMTTRESIYDAETLRSRYNSRYFGLKRAIERLETDIKQRNLPKEAAAAENPTQFETGQIVRLQTLLDLLKKFVERVYGNFGGAFDKDSPFEHSTNYSFEYILYTLSKQITRDLSIVQLALSQREIQHLPQTWQETKQEQPDTLYLADILANHALQYAKDKGVVTEDTFAITYFQERIEIRVLPYASVLLIGMPFNTQVFEHHRGGLAPSLDLLVLPHEIGHHLYWHGTITSDGQGLKVYEVLDRALQAQGIGENDWRRQWLEEIFADFYSCLIAGPVTVLGFQDLLINKGPLHLADEGHIENEFHQSHTSHGYPPPALRSLLQSAILRGLQDEDSNHLFVDSPAYLDMQWQQVAQIAAELADTGRLFDIPTTTDNAPTQMTADEILSGCQEVIQIMLTTFEQWRPSSAKQLWSQEITTYRAGGTIRWRDDYLDKNRTTHQVGTRHFWTDRFLVYDPDQQWVGQLFRQEIDEALVEQWSEPWRCAIFSSMFRGLMLEREQLLAAFFLPALKADGTPVQERFHIQDYGSDPVPFWAHPFLLEPMLAMIVAPTPLAEFQKEAADQLPTALRQRWERWQEIVRPRLFEPSQQFSVQGWDKEWSAAELQKNFKSLIEAAYTFWQPRIAAMGRSHARLLWIDNFREALDNNFTGKQIDFFANVIRQPAIQSIESPILVKAREFVQAKRKYQRGESTQKVVVDEWANALVFVQGWSTEGPRDPVVQSILTVTIQAK